MRLVNYGTLVAPYDLCACADIGDVPVNPDQCGRHAWRASRPMIRDLQRAGVTPLSIGGDHIVSYPILRALGAKRAARHDPRGCAQRHRRHLFRRPEAHPRHAVPARHRGWRARSRSAWSRSASAAPCIPPDERAMGARSGHPHHRHGGGRREGHCPTPSPRRGGWSATAPTYFTFDINSIDPAFAPGTGTPEIGGFTSREALQLVRGFRHLDLVGADMVEVSPPLDPDRQHGAGRRLDRLRAAVPPGRSPLGAGGPAGRGAACAAVQG